MYNQTILEHAKYPQNMRPMENPTIKQSGANPLCGDSLELYLKLDQGIVRDVSFTGQGCAVSKAAASILTEALPGKSKDQIERMTTDDMLALLGGAKLTPARIKCAILALETAKVALEQID